MCREYKITPSLQKKVEEEFPPSQVIYAKGDTESVTKNPISHRFCCRIRIYYFVLVSSQKYLLLLLVDYFWLF